MEGPAHAPALEDPVGFEALSDDLVLRACLRAPFVTHGSLHAVCQRFKSLLRSDAFRQQRVEHGLAEYGLVVAGGMRDGDSIVDCWMLLNGRWRSITPLSGRRPGACSAIVEDEDGQPEMWVMGGYDGGDLATVEAYNPRANTWR